MGLRGSRNVGTSAWQATVVPHHLCGAARASPCAGGERWVWSGSSALLNWAGLGEAMSGSCLCVIPLFVFSSHAWEKFFKQRLLDWSKRSCKAASSVVSSC